MKFTDKILVQGFICLLIFAMVRTSATIEQEDFVTIRENVKEAAQRHYSLEDVKAKGREVLDKIIAAPATLASVVTQANEGSQFSAPIDETSEEEIQAVHAVSGGKVIYSGIDKALGSCVKIQHQNKISTYGNLYTITVVTGERVRKGDIVGTFDREGSKEFYYQLEDNVV